ncbi:hypothetical protein AB0L71_11625 [Streptomyces sp. NPDC052052]|uniref:hypothetical protein n=1 Tax=Streptomyces sp. NPDC052052 TaxID=3154756 RepID=UPI003415D23A
MALPPTGGSDRRPAASPLPLQELSTTERLVGSDAGALPPGARPDGPVFVVETESDDGMHEVVGIRHPDDVRPSEENRTELRSAVRALLDLIGHETGPARTEVLLHAGGPQVLSCSLDSGGAAPRSLPGGE